MIEHLIGYEEVCVAVLGFDFAAGRHILHGLFGDIGYIVAVGVNLFNLFVVRIVAILGFVVAL